MNSRLVQILLKGLLECFSVVVALETEKKMEYAPVRVTTLFVEDKKLYTL